MPTKKPLSFEGVHQFLRTLFADDLHAKRVLSLAGATLGVIESASLAVAMIGQGLALARGRLIKHAIPLDAPASGKQVDRLLSNPGIDVDALLVHWVPYVVGSRSSITVAMDWTDFDADGQATIMLSLLCRHGRATPLVWLTVGTATLKDRRNACEDQVLMRLAEVLPAGVRVRIVADRGFGDQKLYRMLADELRFDFVIRFRGNIKVTAADGEARPAAEWVGAGGRARVLRGATVTAAGCPVATVVCVQAKDMKQPWCLAASATQDTARALVNLYGKRWGIEGMFQQLESVLNSEIRSLGHPRAALLGFAVAVLAHNVLALLQRCVEQAHQDQEPAPEVSAYHLALHVRGGYEGMLIALPPEQWRSSNGDPTALADRLMQLARNIDPRQVAISKRGPKVAKPKEYVDGAVARAQVSTARMLAQARAGTP